MDRFFRAFSVSGAKFVGYTDVDTGTHADQDSGKQSDQKRCGTHSSKCQVVRKPSYNRNIA